MVVTVVVVGVAVGVGVMAEKVVVMRKKKVVQIGMKRIRTDWRVRYKLLIRWKYAYVTQRD